MKNRYSVVEEQCTPQIVLATYPFRWMAACVALAYGGEAKGYGVAITPRGPQAFINLSTVSGEAVGVLFGLVARSDDGRWTTVHDADVPLPEEAQKILDRVLA